MTSCVNPDLFTLCLLANFLVAAAAVPPQAVVSAWSIRQTLAATTPVVCPLSHRGLRETPDVRGAPSGESDGRSTFASKALFQDIALPSACKPYTRAIALRRAASLVDLSCHPSPGRFRPVAASTSTTISKKVVVYSWERLPSGRSVQCWVHRNPLNHHRTPSMMIGEQSMVVLIWPRPLT